MTNYHDTDWTHIDNASADRYAALYEIVAQICATNGNADKIEWTFQRLRASFFQALSKRWIKTTQRTPVVFYLNKFGKIDFRFGAKYLPENDSETRDAIVNGWGWKEVAVLDNVIAFEFYVTEREDEGAPSREAFEARLAEIRAKYESVTTSDDATEEVAAAPTATVEPLDAVDAESIVETFRAKHNLDANVATFDALREAVRKCRTFANFAVVTSDRAHGIHWKIVASRATLAKEAQKNAYIGALNLRDLSIIA